MFAERELAFAKRFREAWSAGDRTAALRHAHDLRSVASTLGAFELAAAAGALEEGCSGEGDPEALLASVTQRLDPLVSALRAGGG
jgi:HPt (histidine-containing phosphotransfer) domain-containing protein